MTRKNLDWIAIGDLTPWARNARTHSKKQIRQRALRHLGLPIRC